MKSSEKGRGHAVPIVAGCSLAALALGRRRRRLEVDPPAGARIEFLTAVPDDECSDLGCRPPTAAERARRRRHPALA